MRIYWLACLLFLPPLNASPLYTPGAQAAPRDPAAQEIPASRSKVNPAQDSSPIKVEIKHPISLGNIALLDLGSGKARLAKLASADNTSFLIAPAGGPEQVIDSYSIIEWSVGDFSETKFSGADAVSGGLGFAAGALLFPSPATPLLLLLSPFMGMASANKFSPDWRIAVREIGPDGREQLVLLQVFTEKDALILRWLLENNSGLKAGQRKSDTELLAVRSQRLTTLEKLIQEAKLPLIRAIPKKPWCSSLDLSGDSGDTGEYKRLLEAINKLRNIIGKDPYDEMIMGNSQLQWERYLADRPDLSQWARANPSAAVSLQKCPTLSDAQAAPVNRET